jgi:membrane protease YdiL (CAAX protease family)
MEPELLPPDRGSDEGLEIPQELTAATADLFAPKPAEKHYLRWIFIGSEGLRAGWSVAIFIPLTILLAMGIGRLFLRLHLVTKGAPTVFTPRAAIFGELIGVTAILCAAALVALIERRRNSVLAFNLTGPRPVIHFVTGLVAGFVALSVLVWALTLGGWMHFGSVALSGANIARYAVLWGCAFLLVGCFEEGTFRCYLQFTLTRGINFWWALGLVGAMCADLVLTAKGNGLWGVYGMALLGVAPCLVLHLQKVEGNGFWQAAWVTSTLFGFVHTSNNGENWIGIFAAALIGFVFVVSIRVTGSAWWAIGCHASWDWAETYFYGAADSGNMATGHYLTTTAAGNALWSGGTDGPEGSLLVLPVILLLLLAILVLYGRKRPEAVGQMAA